MTLLCHTTYATVVSKMGDNQAATMTAPVSLTWRDHDPAAVTLTVGGLDWTFDRALLEREVIGTGDVKVNALSFHYRVHLSGVDGEATIDIPRATVDSFLDQLKTHCPPEAVEYDVSAWLTNIEREDI